MPRLTSRLPSYRHHRASGQAVVTLGGRDIYLGRHGSPESRASYERVMAEWLAANRHAAPRAVTATESPRPSSALTANELFVAYWEFARGYYVKNGAPTDELANLRDALKPMIEGYGATPVVQFGPLALKAVRDRMSASGLCRNVINSRVNRIRRMFKWAVSNELVDASVLHALQAVAPLKRGRCAARESEPVKPVPQADIDAVLPHASPQVAAMIRIQLLTGMRPGEVCLMRTCDLDTTGMIWTYTPASHKTEHHGRARIIYLGPQAQEVLRPWLKSELSAFLFSPREAMEREWSQRRANRKSPMTPSQAMRKRRRDPARTPGDRYTTSSYDRAINAACRKAFPPPEHLRPAVLATGRRETVTAFRKRLLPEAKQELRKWHRAHHWSPNRLRHNAATFLRREFGIDAARVILGHSSAATTEIYAELDQAKALKIMGEVG